MCPRTHCSCRKHCNFLCHRAWSCWGTCYTYCYFFWKLQTALKYRTVQQPFPRQRSASPSLRNSCLQGPCIFLIVRFTAFSLVTYVANICRWYILYFTFVLASKQAIRREYCGKFSVITGWEFKETSCFLTEIFPSTVNLERSELNHAKSGIFDNLNR